MAKRGGARPGAGRPRKLTNSPVVRLLEAASRRRGLEHPPAQQTAAGDPEASAYQALTIPPEGLTTAQMTIWRALAGFAVDAGTLVPSTVAGFWELCEQMALKAELWEQVKTLKPASAEGRPVLSLYIRLSQRVESSLGRFKLTAVGKPAEEMTGGRIVRPAQPAASGWASIAK